MWSLDWGFFLTLNLKKRLMMFVNYYLTRTRIWHNRGRKPVLNTPFEMIFVRQNRQGQVLGHHDKMIYRHKTTGNS